MWLPHSEHLLNVKFSNSCPISSFPGLQSNNISPASLVSPFDQDHSHWLTHVFYHGVTSLLPFLAKPLESIIPPAVLRHFSLSEACSDKLCVPIILAMWPHGALAVEASILLEICSYLSIPEARHFWSSFSFTRCNFLVSCATTLELSCHDYVYFLLSVSPCRLDAPSGQEPCLS